MADSLFNRLEKIPVSNKKQRFVIKFGGPDRSDDKPKKASVTISRKIDSAFNRNAVMKKLKRRVKLNQAPKAPNPLEPPPEISMPAIPEEPAESKVGATVQPKKKGKKT